MGLLLRRINRLAKAELNYAKREMEAQKAMSLEMAGAGGVDLEKLLELAYLEIQGELIECRQEVTQATVAQKRTEKQYNDAQNEANKWHRYAQLALQKGDENLARQALERKRAFNKSSEELKTSSERQAARLDSLNRNLARIESKISEVKAKREKLKARTAAAKAQTVRGLNTSNALAAFERMEERVLMQEVRARSASELAGADLETQFQKLEAGSDVDNELAAMKAQMNLPGASPTPPQPDTSNREFVDVELESLRKQLDNL